jgi:hypothetical protein
MAVGHARVQQIDPQVLLPRGSGNGSGMNSDTVVAMSGLMGLAAAALTGALWGTPLARAPSRWFMS